jgi:hypothetical protein
MANRFEFRDGRAADALAWGIRTDEIGKIFFEIEQFVIKPIVSAVRNARLGADVVSLVVAPDFFSEFGVASFRLRVRHTISISKRFWQDSAEKKTARLRDLRNIRQRRLLSA